MISYEMLYSPLMKLHKGELAIFIFKTLSDDMERHLTYIMPVEYVDVNKLEPTCSRFLYNK